MDDSEYEILEAENEMFEETLEEAEAKLARQKPVMDAVKRLREKWVVKGISGMDWEEWYFHVSPAVNALLDRYNDTE